MMTTRATAQQPEYRLTCTVEHATGTDTYVSNVVREDRLDAAKADYRRDAPAGSTITFQLRQWTAAEMA